MGPVWKGWRAVKMISDITWHITNQDIIMFSMISSYSRICSDPNASMYMSVLVQFLKLSTNATISLGIRHTLFFALMLVLLCFISAYNFLPVCTKFQMYLTVLNHQWAPKPPPWWTVNSCRFTQTLLAYSLLSPAPTSDSLIMGPSSQPADHSSDVPMMNDIYRFWSNICCHLGNVFFYFFMLFYSACYTGLPADPFSASR